jgi:hypothetical protein
MKWLRNPNIWFILITIVISVITCIFLISLLKVQDKNEINIITIVGTVLTISALVFTIKEQYRLKKISTAIKNNTKEIQEKLIYKSFEWNIERCSKYINEIQNAFNEPNLTRLFVRLIDLKEGLIECKKVINIHKYFLSDGCLERLKTVPATELSQKKIVDLLDEIGKTCKVERIFQLDEFVKDLTAHIVQIQSVKFEKTAIKDPTVLLSKIGEIHTYINEIKQNQIVDV